MSDNFLLAWRNLHDPSHIGPKPDISSIGCLEGVVDELISRALVSAPNDVLQNLLPEWAQAIFELMAGRPIDGMDNSQDLWITLNILKSEGLLLRGASGAGDILSRKSIVFPESNWNVPIYAFFYEHPKPFYIIILPFVGQSVEGVYFPISNQLLALSPRPNASQSLQKNLMKFVTFSIKNYSVIYDYLKNTEKCEFTPVFAPFSGHFAHSIWNEVAALDRLQACWPSRATVVPRSEPAGRLAELFPEIKSNISYNCLGLEFECFYAQLLVPGGTVVPLGSLKIPDTTITRIKSAAIGAFPNDDLRVGTLRQEHDFILWVTIRADGRTAINFKEVITQINMKFLNNYRNALIIFDGFSQPFSQNTNQMTLLLKSPSNNEIVEEKILAETVSALGNSISTLSLLGLTLQQAFIYGAAADAYFCHHGTLQHKIAWFHSVPGVAHGPDLSGIDITKTLGIDARGPGRRPHYVLAPPVPNSETGLDARKDMYNYLLNCDEAVEALARVAQASPRKISDASGRNNVKKHVSLATEHRENFARESLTLIEKGNAEWSRGHFGDALMSFSAAVKVAPFSFQAYSRLVTFLALSASSRPTFLPADKRLSMLLCVLALENNRYALKLLAEHLVNKPQDEADAIRCALYQLCPHLDDLAPKLGPERARE